MFITKRSLSRRTALRGLGATVALPFLDAMVPALTAARQTAANPARRFGAVFVPHGERPGYWTPNTVGSNFEITPILKPLEPFRDSMTVVSELCLPLNGHATTVSGWLSGAIPKQTFAEDVRSATTVDQVIAKQIGQETPLPSLEVATENVEGFIGGCDALYSCAYMNTIAWKSETSPMPMEINPRMLFERMFGAPGTPEQRKMRMHDSRSILDSAAADAHHLLEKRLGSKDRSRLSDYLDNIREIEGRIQRAETHSATNVTIVPDAPIGIPESWEEHCLLMYELLALAYASDTTRVFTFMKARDASNRVYSEVGITEPHHSLSHHGAEKDKIDKLVKLNTYHVSLFAKFVEKLRNTPDGDGSLLDHSLILFGSGMSESNNHSRLNVPTLLVGGGDILKGNRHVRAPRETPIGNLLLDLAGKFGCDVDKFGVSTGRFEV
jgi:hypothetical protein